MEQIGPYRTQEELGRGGMGVVYRARGPMGETVALKVMLPGRGASDRARKRFELEVEALTRLRHPGIVPFLACGQHEGTPWVALEYVEGETLTARLRRGPPAVAEAIEWGRQLAEALAHVHAQGLLHRDLKPDNVLLRDGQALLTDFGLALDTADEGSRLTQTGVHVGTPGFWAPEQGRGDVRAHATWTDVYGLGAVLYACLTGYPPVRGQTLQACMASGQFEQIVPPAAERAQIPEWLSAVVMRCLSFDPSRRPSLGAVARSLRQARDLTAENGARLAKVAGALALLAAVSVVTALTVISRSWAGGDPGVAAVDSGDAADAEPALPQLPRCFALSGKPSAELDAALALYEPWCFTPTAEGLELRAQGAARPELLVPLTVREGASWSLRTRLSGIQLVTTGYVGAWLASFPNVEAEGAEEIPWRAIGWRLALDGSFHPQLRVPDAPLYAERVQEQTLALDVDPREPLTIDLRWDPPRLRVEVSSRGVQLAEHEQTLDPQLVPSGPAVLRVGRLKARTLPSLGTAHGDWEGGRVAVRFDELSLRGEGLELDPARLQQLRYLEGQLGWWFASGLDPLGLRQAIDDLKRASLRRPRSARLLPYLLAWLSLREGDVDEAVRQLSGLLALSQGYYPEPVRWTDVFHWVRNRVQADLPLYPRELRARLHEVLPPERSLRDALEVAFNPPPDDQLDRSRYGSRGHASDCAWLEVALRMLAEPLDGVTPPAAEALYQTGLYEDLDPILADASPPTDEYGARWRGWYAFHRQRYRRALELWEHVEPYPALERARGTARRWAK